MLTVGCETSISSASRQLTSRIQWSTPSCFLVAASLIRPAATAIIFFSASESGRALSAKRSIAGVFPSAETSVLSACTRCHAGLSTRALLLEWVSRFGPRPQRSPLATSSSSTTPFAPRLIVTSPPGSCDGKGMNTPSQRFKAERTSGRLTTCEKCGEPISSSPSATNTRLTGGFLPAPRMAWRDRKSTRLNSSHVAISYAVFCLKKKKKKKKECNKKQKTNKKLNY